MSLQMLSTGARFSTCRRYRYWLFRKWDQTKRSLVFVMLNPSTADEQTNDPTVERCQRRALAMPDVGGLIVVNLFALRSTDPRVLYQMDDPVGPENDAAILIAAQDAAMVICGWGIHGHLRGRGDQVIAMLRRHQIEPYALGRNSDGSPKHPLYVSYKIQPVKL